MRLRINKRFNVYQKVEGQKHGYNTALAMAGFNAYQKVDGQKPSISNMKPLGMTANG